MRWTFARTIIVVVAGLTIAVPSFADGPKPFPEFTFKRVTVPTGGSGPRITVQIEPEAPSSEAEPSEEANTDATVATAYEWFWTEVSPSLSASGPGRLDTALRRIDQGPGVSTPRLSDLQRMLETHHSSILVSTIGTKVSPALVLSVIAVESGGDAGAVSSAGATGVMQLMPDTAARFGAEDRTDPAQNIKAGVAYLNWLMEEFESDPILVLAGYNAGEGAVRRYEGVPPYAETRGYVPKVLAAWSVARGLCQTPPELITDGCAFGLQGS
ncbi:Membrane-bound lytic murein transglycosylase D precursor [Candidatus Rhodobacter oscarellae]|uniref:Membrane-bound lytic murein transglycosylase D n=1 Tax=Candidatus Rhodobacter oscarellae TaxID=1675527 RepID=A0A0J9E9Q5_9RHOB|nr:lytic transglycosylase domain-containing protein [Candidatus Rhodobacter lobularis]KMW59527.1 Membrane-bound lytic murein transglycosylase D precursor [Candidatus Rhodobacter lobularis]